MNTTRITKDENGEYRVRLFVDGKYQAGADYFTDDQDDAKGTAKLMRRDGGISDKTTSFAKDEQADFDNELAGINSRETMIPFISCRLASEDFELFKSVVNQGIDSRWVSFDFKE